jgi:hypothetical protein
MESTTRLTGSRCAPLSHVIVIFDVRDFFFIVVVVIIIIILIIAIVVTCFVRVHSPRLPLARGVVRDHHSSFSGHSTCSSVVSQLLGHSVAPRRA